MYEITRMFVIHYWLSQFARLAFWWLACWVKFSTRLFERSSYQQRHFLTPFNVFLLAAVYIVFTYNHLMEEENISVLLTFCCSITASLKNLFRRNKASESDPMSPKSPAAPVELDSKPLKSPSINVNSKKTTAVEEPKQTKGRCVISYFSTSNLRHLCGAHNHLLIFSLWNVCTVGKKVISHWLTA